MAGKQSIVYAKSSCHVFFGDGRFQVRENEPWDASDPLVKAKPDLFATSPVEVKTSGLKSRKVEQATAAPGETRGA